MANWIGRMRRDPTPWLLEKACPSIRLRTLTEIHGRGPEDPEVTALRQEVYAYEPPHKISTLQSDDGTWFASLDGFETLNVNRKRGPGTTWQFLALTEYGWGRDHPIIWRSMDLLMGLLFEDRAVDLREMKGYCSGDPAVEAHLRRALSRKAMALLCRTGLDQDPGVRHRAGPFLKELDAFYRGDVQAKLYQGTKTRMVETETGPAEEVCTLVAPMAPYPDHALLRIFAFNPALRADPVGRDLLRRIVDYMFAVGYPPAEVVSVGGKDFDRRPDFGIRNYGRGDYESRKLVGQLLQDLELLARCGVLETQPKALELLEWLISLQDEEGVVRGEEFVEKTYNPVDYPFFPLEDNWRGKHKKFTDITFRLFLILSILDRQPAG